MNLFHRKPEPAGALQAVPISEDGFLIDLPARLRIGREKDNTLAAFLPGWKHGVLRFSTLMLELKLKLAALELGAEHVRLLAQKTTATLQEEDGRLTATYVEELLGPPVAVMTYSFAASRNTVLVASLWIEKGKESQPQAAELRSACQGALRSFRPNPLYGPDPQARLAHNACSPLELAFLQERRRMAAELVRTHLGLPGLPAGREGLPVLQSLLDRKAVSKNNITALEALGVAFGDILASEAGLEWAVESEPRGDIVIVRPPGTHTGIYATTLIWKRIERGEKVDISHLLAQLTAQLTSMLAAASPPPASPS